MEGHDGIFEVAINGNVVYTNQSVCSKLPENEEIFREIHKYKDPLAEVGAMENGHEKGSSPTSYGRSEEPNEAGSAGSSACCPPGSSQECCSGYGEGVSAGGRPPQKSWGKTVVFVAVILAAAAVGGYSLLQRSDTRIEDPGQPASASCCPGAGTSCGTALKPPKSVARLTAGKEAVFVLLPGKNDKWDEAAIRKVEAVVNKLESRGKRVAAFPLGRHWEAYDDLVNQYSVKSFPCVMVLGKSGQAAKLNGNITEKRLLRAYAQASKPASSCGVRCDPSACGK